MKQLFLEPLLLLDQRLSSPDDISAGYVIFFADSVWEPSCEGVRESNAIVFPLPPHQQAKAVSDPTGALQSGKEIKFSAPRFPKVIMQSLDETTQEKGRKKKVSLCRSSRWLSLIECMYLATRKDSTYCALTYQMAPRETPLNILMLWEHQAKHRNTSFRFIER